MHYHGTLYFNLKQADVLVQVLKVHEMDPALKIISDAAEKDEEYQQICAAIAAGKRIEDLQKGHPGWILNRPILLTSFELGIYLT